MTSRVLLLHAVFRNMFGWKGGDRPVARYGTFVTSILPMRDCCAIFFAEHRDAAGNAGRSRRPRAASRLKNGGVRSRQCGEIQ
jgi:hypothetical protein